MVLNTVAKAIESNLFRFERKFFVEELTFHELEAMVRLHPALFREVYPWRWVNNLYLDSPELSSYFENVAGIADRMKVRIRWYGDLRQAVERPVLELKIKRGLTGTKLAFPLDSLVSIPGVNRRILRRCFARSEMPPDIRELLKGLEPALLNRYRRKYYESSDRKVRLTLDWERGFSKFDPLGVPFLQKWPLGESTIVELKYDPDADERAAAISNEFPFRLTKSSKYVQGLEVISLN